MMKKNKSLGLNAFLNGLKSVLNLLFPLLTFPYVSRVLSVDGMGIYNFSYTYVNYFLLLAGLGISTYAIREGAKYRDNKNAIDSFSSEMFSINLVSTILAYILLILSLVIFKNLNNYVSCILIFSLQILFTTLGTEWIYTIYEDYAYITIRSILFKIVSIIFLFIFVRNSGDYLVYAGITVLAGVGSNILNFFHARALVRIRITKKIRWKYHLKPILIIFASVLAVNIYVSSDTTILGLLKSDYAVGIYGVSVKIYTIVQSLLSAILTVTIPRLAMLWGRNRKKEYLNLLSNLIKSFSILVLPATVGLAMLSKEVVLIIAGKKYLPSVNSLIIICWAIIFSIFSWIFSQCILIPLKREGKVLKNTIITSLVNIILNFVFIPFMSYDGTSLSTVLAELMVMIMNGYACKDILVKVLSKENLKSIASSIIGCLGIILICFLCKIGISNLWIRTIFSIVLSVGIYGAILVFLKNDVALEYLSKLLHK